MLIMLVVLYLLIARVREPATWQWLMGEPVAAANPEDAADQDEPQTPVATTDKPSRVQTPLPSREDSPKSYLKWLVDGAQAPPVQAPLPPAEDSTVTDGPTDEDEEQRAAAIEEFQAVTDRTLGLAPEEMTVYWRLFSWAEHQSFAEMRKRSQKQIMLNDFMQLPDKQRGKLVKVKLNVRQIIPYPAPENSAGIEKVYEVRGFTDESKAWLYFGVTAHLPPGMPTGTKVEETATFVGYFIKLQGYHEAGAKPNAKRLAAPLLVGRMAWKPPAAPTPVKASDSAWMLWLLAPIGAFFMVWVALPLLWPKSPRKEIVARMKSAPENEEVNVEEWLSQAQQGQLSKAEGGQTRIDHHAGGKSHNSESMS